MAVTWIDNDLKFDAQGKIKILTGLEAKKSGIRLYFQVLRGEIPFSNFGNTALYQIFRSNSESEINTFVLDLLDSLRDIFDVIITDYDVIIQEHKIKITLFLGNDEILEETILML